MTANSIVTTVNGCPDDAPMLPADPFTALHYHFGMLLGVDDFETDQAYHRGKQRLHNAWAHREGVLWGLGVRADLAEGELWVDPGLALDPAGEELHLDQPSCVDVGNWFDKHRTDAGFDFQEMEGTVIFQAHVEMRLHPCLTRQVPAMSEPCTGASTDTAYSRVYEKVEIKLVPGKVEVEAPPMTYHRLRLLFGLEQATLGDDGKPAAADQEVLDRKAAILALDAASQPAAYLYAFRDFAALDEIDLRPAQDPTSHGSLLFPAPDATPIVLANVYDVTLKGQTGGWTLSNATVDNTIRKSHVATLALEELLCGPLVGMTDASGPRIDPKDVSFNATTVTIKANAPLLASTVKPEAFSVTAIDDNAGWSDIAVNQTAYDAPTNTITLTLASTTAGLLVRLIARGAGPRPLLGADHVPLAGAAGGPPGTANDGNDFVLMKVG